MERSMTYGFHIERVSGGFILTEIISDFPAGHTIIGSGSLQNLNSTRYVFENIEDLIKFLKEKLYLSYTPINFKEQK